MRTRAVLGGMLAALVAAGLTVLGLRTRAIEARAICAENTKMICLGLLTYADKHDGRLPGPDWPMRIAPYIPPARDRRPVLVCPARPHLRVGYALNEALMGQRLSDIDQPSETVMIFDSDNGPGKPYGGRESLASPSRHGGYIMLGFADGRVEGYSFRNGTRACGHEVSGTEWSLRAPADRGASVRPGGSR